MTKVFLGGTTTSQYRQLLIPKLTIDYFDPIVPDWTPEAQANEEKEKLTCDYRLYVLTSKLRGVYSIAELTHDACMVPSKTIFAVLQEGDPFDEFMLKSLKRTRDLCVAKGALYLKDLDAIAEYLNASA